MQAENPQLWWHLNPLIVPTRLTPFLRTRLRNRRLWPAHPPVTETMRCRPVLITLPPVPCVPVLLTDTVWQTLPTLWQARNSAFLRVMSPLRLDRTLAPSVPTRSVYPAPPWFLPLY